MKRDKIKHTILVLMLMLTGVGMTGCKEEPSSGEEGPVGSMVSLTFNLETGSTRGDGHPEWGDDDSTTKLYSGWIHVYIHDDETDELKLHLTDGKISPYGTILTEELEEGEIKVELSTRTLTPGRKYRLSVMANCQDANGLLYSVSSPFRNTEESKTFLQKPHFTPFAGFRTFILASASEEITEQVLNDICLLRSVARIDVLLGDELEGKWQIEKAILPEFGNKLYACSYASTALENIKGAEGTEYLEMGQMFNPHTGVIMKNPTGPDLELRDVNEDRKSFRIYLPEQPNPLNEEEIYVRLDLKHLLTGQKMEAKLYLRDLTGEPLNLVRNHIYRYRVRSVKPLFDVDVAIISPERQEITIPPFN